MRIVSYILMQLAPGTAKTAAEKIAKIQGVKMAHAVTGPFDVIAFAEVPDPTTLSDLLLAKIQNIEGVQKPRGPSWSRRVPSPQTDRALAITSVPLHQKNG